MDHAHGCGVAACCEWLLVRSKSVATLARHDACVYTRMCRVRVCVPQYAYAQARGMRAVVILGDKEAAADRVKVSGGLHRQIEPHTAGRSPLWPSLRPHAGVRG